MADYYYGNISIWGDIKEEDLSTLLDALDNDQPEKDANTYEEHIRDNLGDTLEFEDVEARYGGFTNIEDACKDLGLSYLRYSGSDYDASPCNSWYVNGEEGFNVLTNDDEIYMAANSIVMFCETAREFKGENAPALINSSNMFESILAKHFLSTGEVLTIEEYAQGLLTEVPEPGSFNIIS